MAHQICEQEESQLCTESLTLSSWEDGAASLRGEGLWEKLPSLGAGRGGLRQEEFSSGDSQSTPVCP